MPGTEAAAELGVYLLSEEGRAAYAEEYEPDEAPAVYGCEMFLSDVLADASYQLP
ncbi:hypothetical protein ACN2WE_29685 [Streptomyces sp. cg28]|uniref:hypothetical protein n=1 Tax=Streptomyces sp. cg28 TaxID=3403457 RepID=UPI003B20DD49